jgi:hypothetical protein
MADQIPKVEVMNNAATFMQSEHDAEKGYQTAEIPNDQNGPTTLSRVSSEAPYTIFSRSTRVFILFMVAVSALISPFAATLYYPALNPLAEQLHVSSSLINLSITTYMVRKTYERTWSRRI